MTYEVAIGLFLLVCGVIAARDLYQTVRGDKDVLSIAEAIISVAAFGFYIIAVWGQYKFFGLMGHAAALLYAIISTSIYIRKRNMRHK